jgi:hypothetical protein
VIKGKKHPKEKKERRNMSRNTIAMAVLGLVLVAALALPVSAAKAEGKATGKAAMIDSGLKNDLWDVYGKYRIQIYDLRVEGANEGIGVLAKYGCPTGDLEVTMTDIEEQRDPLEKALENHDGKALQEVNQVLAKLWKQFREQFKESIRTCFGQPVGVKTTAEAEL